MEKILITGVGGDIGQGILKCLKEINPLFYLIGCDTDRYAAGRKLVNRFHQAPPVTYTDRYHGFIDGLLREENISYLFPVTEPEINFFNRHRSDFGKVNIIIHGSHILSIFLDKYKTVEFLKHNQMLYPQTYLLENYRNELEPPYILKPRTGCGKKGLLVVHEPVELDGIRKQVSGYVVQERIGSDDEEYTITVFSTSQKCYTIAFRRYLGYGSLTKTAHLVQDPQLPVLAEKIARAVSLEGSLNIQCRKTDTGYVPFEINPRFSSTVYTRHYFGFHDVKWWLRMKAGKSIEYRLRYKGGVAVRTVDETFFDLKS